MTKMTTSEEPNPSPPEPGGPFRVPWPLRALLLSSLVLLLLAVGAEWNRQAPPPSLPASATPGPDDRALLPGYRAGFIVLNMPVKAVEEKLGTGVIRPSETALLYIFQSAGLSCGVQDGKVVSVSVRSAGLKTRGGLGVGSDVDQVIREFGDHYEWDGGATPTPGAPPPERYTLHYWSEGIHFSVVHTHVDTIQITPAVEAGS